VGTSPLYVFSSIFTDPAGPDHDDILGTMSLIFWTLTLVALVKYALSPLTIALLGKRRLFAQMERMAVFYKAAHFHQALLIAVICMGNIAYLAQTQAVECVHSL
jgi:K+ transporter